MSSVNEQASAILEAVVRPIVVEEAGEAYAIGFFKRNNALLIAMIIDFFELGTDASSEESGEPVALPPSPLTVRFSFTDGVVVCGHTKPHKEAIKSVRYRGKRARFSSKMSRRSEGNPISERCAWYYQSTRGSNARIEDVRAVARQLAAAARVRVNLAYEDPRTSELTLETYAEQSGTHERSKPRKVFPVSITNAKAVEMLELLTTGLTEYASAQVGKLGNINGVEIRWLRSRGGATIFMLHADEAFVDAPQMAEVARSPEGQWAVIMHAASDQRGRAAPGLVWDGSQWKEPELTREQMRRGLYPNAHGYQRAVERWISDLARLPRQHVLRHLRASLLARLIRDDFDGTHFDGDAIVVKRRFEEPIAVVEIDGTVRSGSVELGRYLSRVEEQVRGTVLEHSVDSLRLRFSAALRQALLGRAAETSSEWRELVETAKTAKIPGRVLLVLPWRRGLVSEAWEELSRVDDTSALFVLEAIAKRAEERSTDAPSSWEAELAPKWRAAVVRGLERLPVPTSQKQVSQAAERVSAWMTIGTLLRPELSMIASLQGGQPHGAL